MRRLSAFTVIVIASAISVSAQDGTLTAVPSCVPAVVYVDERGGQTDIFLLTLNDGKVTQITDDGMHERAPVYSPDGTRIAYQGYPIDRMPAEVYIVDADGTGQFNLSQNEEGEDWSPAWSPDGESIMFYSERDDGAALYVMAADGGDPVIIPGTSYGAMPDWSPDGERIAYRKELPWNDEIFVINADGSEQVNLTNTRINDFSPDWSPDGSRIVFESGSDIFVMNPDGSDLVRLTDNPLDDQSPRWSPDGTAILYTHHGELYVMNPDGTEQRRLTGSHVNGLWASWRPCPHR